LLLVTKAARITCTCKTSSFNLKPTGRETHLKVHKGQTKTVLPNLHIQFTNTLRRSCLMQQQSIFNAAALQRDVVYPPVLPMALQPAHQPCGNTLWCPSRHAVCISHTVSDSYLLTQYTLNMVQALNKRWAHGT